MNRLETRKIIITGAASGIGLAISRCFLDAGARIALLDRDGERLKSIQNSLGDGVPFSICDVSSEAETQRAVDELAARLDGVDGVVNSAGIDLLLPFSQMTAARWNELMAVNLGGPFNICRAALDYIRAAGGGTIVNIASGAGLRPLENRTGYCASKAGLIMFSKALACDLSNDNIRVNSICPGIIDTPMLHEGLKNFSRPDEELDRIKARYILNRVGTPDDIASAALYLTSDESSYTTGIALAVDGGRTFH